ncbi:MAG TPA: ACT domain-containing protein, partial [bacterium]|nr:ACT domain-containing protein [bacterium]
AGLALEDIRYAAELGYRVKLLSHLKYDDGHLRLATCPTLIPARHLLAAVRDVYNAVFLTGDLMGESLLLGKGAGMDPTATSVVGDIVSLGREILHGVPAAPLPEGAATLETRGLESRYYFRFTALDQPGVMARIAELLGRHEISISTCLQKEENPAEAVPVIILTHRTRETQVRKALSEIDRLPVIKARTVMMRLAFDN